MSRSQCLIRRRGVTPLQSRAGILHRHVLVFDFRAIPFLEPAYGNIRATHERDAEVHGVLHQLTHQQWQKLYDFECGGAVNPYCYHAVDKEVYTYDGAVMSAIVLVMPQTSPLLMQGIKPSSHYLRLLQQGAMEHHLHQSYQQYLRDYPNYRASTLAISLGGVMLLAHLALLLPMLLLLFVYLVVTGATRRFKPYAMMLLSISMWVYVRVPCLRRCYRGQWSSSQPVYRAALNDRKQPAMAALM